MKNRGFCKIYHYEQQYTLNTTTPPCYIRYGGSILRDEVILYGCDGMTLMITTMKNLSNLIISIENINLSKEKNNKEIDELKRLIVDILKCIPLYSSILRSILF
mgnify:CR=1 FL=1